MATQACPKANYFPCNKTKALYQRPIMRHSTASRCTDLQNKSTVSGRNLSRNYNKSQLSLSVVHGKMVSRPPSRLRGKADFSPIRVIKMYCFVLACYKLCYILVYAY